jgi:excisionase family DNA binding protein
MTQELLVDKRVAADRLGVGLRTVERLLATGELRPVKVGRSTRLVVAELDAFVAELQARRDEDRR